MRNQKQVSVDLEDQAEDSALAAEAGLEEEEDKRLHKHSMHSRSKLLKHKDWHHRHHHLDWACHQAQNQRCRKCLMRMKKKTNSR